MKRHICLIGVVGWRCNLRTGRTVIATATEVLACIHWDRS